MKILHYTLGPPPLRSGGLTRYAMDLIEEQSQEHEIIHLHPGKVNLLNRKTKVVQKKDKNKNNISNFQIENSLPLPLFRGISTPKDFMKATSKDIFKEFLEEVEPEVIHIHTLMGLHREFLEVANELEIKLVYTTHDYFGICPTINLYKDNKGSNCSDFNNGRGCIECCKRAVNTKTLLLTQTPFYSTIKKIKRMTTVFPKLASNIEMIKKTEPNEEYEEFDDQTANEYLELREFYLEMYKKIDFFHFNSILAQEVFKEYLPEVKGIVVNITHGEIKKITCHKEYSNKIRVGYLGPMKEHKGFFNLMTAFLQLPPNLFELHLYGDDTRIQVSQNIHNHGKYNIENLKEIFSKLDVLVVPSVWKETFGFIALESLSHGTPIIMSTNVGSKDLVNERFGWAFKSGETTELVKVMKELTKASLNVKSQNIVKDLDVTTMKKHSEEIISFYKKTEEYRSLK